MQNQPLVKNAANEKQLKNAEVREKLALDRELNDMRAVLATPEGRRVLASIMAECRVHSSVWHPSAMIHKLAGAQEIGQLLMRKMVMADRKLAAEMFIEAYSEVLEGVEDV